MRPNPYSELHMRYPEPETLARRALFLPSPKPRAIYRSNELNPRKIWGCDIPYTLASFDASQALAPVLVFGSFVAPLVHYLPTLLATAHIPAATQHKHITHTPPPGDPYYAVLELASIVPNDTLAALQRRAVLRAYRARRGPGDARTANPHDALSATAALMDMTVAATRKALLAEGVDEVGVDRSRERPARTTSAPRHGFSRAYEHAYKFRVLTSAVQICRSNATGQHKFTLADLEDPAAPGGYPTHCPVTGDELNWEDHMSYFAPRIGRKDPTQPYVSGNVHIVSKVGKAIVEGTVTKGMRRIVKEK